MALSTRSHDMQTELMNQREQKVGACFHDGRVGNGFRSLQGMSQPSPSPSPSPPMETKPLLEKRNLEVLFPWRKDPTLPRGSTRTQDLRSFYVGGSTDHGACSVVVPFPATSAWESFERGQLEVATWTSFFERFLGLTGMDG